MDVTKMTEKELREELTRIRMERAGCGQKKRTEAKGKRISESAKLKKITEGEANAEWC